MRTEQVPAGFPKRVVLRTNKGVTTYDMESFAQSLRDYYREFYSGESVTEEQFAEEVKNVVWGNIELDLRDEAFFAIVDEDGNDVESFFHATFRR